MRYVMIFLIFAFGLGLQGCAQQPAGSDVDDTTAEEPVFPAEPRRGPVQ